MKYCISLINSILIVSIVIVIITSIQVDRSIICTTMDVKKINSTKLNKKEEIKIKEKEKREEQPQGITPSEEELGKEKIKIEETKDDQVLEPTSKSDVVESFTGSMSGYGPDCRGCMGYTSSGYNIKNTIYYQDSAYGQVRILAGDEHFKIGSIIRVKGSKLNEFIGIVLDRGSAVGIGKKHLFDLLFSKEQEAKDYEVSFNVTFEVLRNGFE